jgi:hypothetical protein
MLPTKSQFIWPNGYRGEDCLGINQSETRWPYFLTDWSEKSNLYRAPTIDASYQVSVHLAKWFQRRFLNSANQKQELPMAVMFVNGLERNEQSL